MAAGAGKRGVAVTVDSWLDAWAHWSGGAGLPHLPLGLHVSPATGSSPHETLAALHMTLAEDQIYDSINELALALQAQLDAFSPWQSHNPAHKPLVSGFISESSGPRWAPRKSSSCSTPVPLTASSVLSWHTCLASHFRLSLVSLLSAWRPQTPHAR